MLQHFNHKNVRDFAQHIETVINRLVNKWKQHSANGQTVVVNEDFYRFTMDVISLVAYGVNLKSIESPLDQENVVVKDISTMMDAILKRAFAHVPYCKVKLIGQYLDGVGFTIDRLRQKFSTLVKTFQKIDPKGGDSP